MSFTLQTVSFSRPQTRRGLFTSLAALLLAGTVAGGCGSGSGSNAAPRVVRSYGGTLPTANGRYIQLYLYEFANGGLGGYGNETNTPTRSRCRLTRGCGGTVYFLNGQRNARSRDFQLQGQLTMNYNDAGESASTFYEDATLTGTLPEGAPPGNVTLTITRTGQTFSGAVTAAPNE
jgi:hypothetical protein